MIVVFGLEPRSAVIAFMLTRLESAKAVLFDPEKQYYFDEIEDARASNFNKIYEEYREKFGKLDFLEEQKLYNVMSTEIFWSLRFKARDNASLLLQVLDQIHIQGSKGYFAETTLEAREMRFRVKRVLGEFNRALRFVRFENHSEVNLKIANASFESDIVDMVLRAEVTRSPTGYIAAIYDEREIEVMLNGETFKAKRQRIPLIPERKDFKNFWRGLPETGRKILVKDEVHSLKEMPEIIFPKDDEREEANDREISSLDDFGN